VVKVWPEALSEECHISREPDLIPRQIVRLGEAGCPNVGREHPNMKAEEGIAPALDTSAATTRSFANQWQCYKMKSVGPSVSVWTF